MKYLLWLFVLLFPVVAFGKVPIDPTPEQQIAQRIAFIAYHLGVNENLAVAIASCESGFKQIRSIKQNNNKTYDWGIFQINSIHLNTAQKMGFNVTKEWEDNVRYGLLLIKKNGAVKDFSASIQCWLPKVEQAVASKLSMK